MTLRSNISGTNILVVGGAGFVGSNLIYALLQYDIKSILIVDNLLSSEKESLPSDRRLSFLEGSIADDEVLKSLNQDFDYIFHLATYHGNQSSIHNPLADHQNNVITTLKLCEKYKSHRGLKKLIYSSAGCTVAEKKYGDVLASTEDQPVSLYHDSPYQISKLVGEFYGNYFFSRYKLPFVKARFQNVYGPGEILGAGEWRGTEATVWRNVIPSFVWKSLMGERLPLENNGLASRDFIYVDDITRGLIACAEHGRSGEVYNLASGVEVSIKDLAEKINDLTNNRAPFKMIEKRAWDRSGNRYGATEKAQKELSFKAKTSLEKGLQETIEWFKKNRELVRANITKHVWAVPELEKYR